MTIFRLMKARSTLRVVFDHVSLQIENLVSEQIAEVSEKNLRVKVRIFAHCRGVFHSSQLRQYYLLVALEKIGIYTIAW